MTDLMRCLYEYIMDNRIQQYLEQPQYRREQLRSDRLWEELTEALSEAEQALLLKYHDAMDELTAMELEAIFQAAWAVSRELASDTGNPL